MKSFMMNTNKRALRKILKAIQDTEAEEMVCREITDEMFVLLAEAQSGARPLTPFDRMRRHLRHCPDCAQRAADVAAALRVVVDERATPAPQRSFDLSFLQASPTAQSVPARVQAAFHDGVRWIQDQHGDLWVNLTASMGLDSPPQYLSITKGETNDSPPGDNSLCHVVLGSDQVDDLDLEVTGTRSVAQPDLCTLSVQAVIPSRWPRLAGVAVDLYDGSRVLHARTDEDGRALFADIPVANLPAIRLRIAR